MWNFIFTILTFIFLKTKLSSQVVSLEDDERRCEEDEVEVRGECVNIYRSGVCPFGERLYSNVMGEGVCKCEEGWARNREGGRCYQEFTRWVVIIGCLRCSRIYLLTNMILFTGAPVKVHRL